MSELCCFISPFFFIKKKDSKCYHSFQIKNRLPLKYLSVALAKTTLRDHGNDP